MTTPDDFVKRIQRNDNETKQIYFNCNKLRKQGYNVDEIGSIFNEETFLCNLGAFALSMNRNLVVDTVFIDPEFIHYINRNTRCYFLRAIGNIPNLKYLNISGCKQQELPVSWVTSLIQSSFNLESLELHNAALIGTKEELSQFSDALLALSCITLKKLMCLQLKSCTLKQGTHLEVKFSDSLGLGHLIAKSISKVPSRSTLEEITITDEGTKSKNNFRNEAFQSLFRLPHLRKLSLNGLCLGADEMEGIADLLKSDSKLESLNLSNNKICYRGCLVIANAFLSHGVKSKQKSNHALKELILSDNHLGSKAGFAIGTILQSCSGLETININNNDIDNDGIAEISKALQYNKSLRTLHICNCKFNDDGFQSLSEALTRNKRLREINLLQNPLSIPSYTSLVNALGENVSIRCLTVDPNIPADLLSKINFYCRLNASSIRRKLLQKDYQNREQFVDLLIQRQQRGKALLQTVSDKSSAGKSKNKDDNTVVKQEQYDHKTNWFGIIIRNCRNLIEMTKRNGGNDDGNEESLSELYFMIRSKPEHVCFTTTARVESNTNKSHVTQSKSIEIVPSERKRILELGNGRIISARTA